MNQVKTTQIYIQPLPSILHIGIRKYIFLTNTMTTKKRSRHTESSIGFVSEVLFCNHCKSIIIIILIKKTGRQNITTIRFMAFDLKHFEFFFLNWCIFHMCMFFFSTGTKLLAKLKMYSIDKYGVILFC